MHVFRSGSSKAVNTRKAVLECLDAAGAEPERLPGLILVHTALGHKFDEMLAELRSRAPDASIAGCTGSGVISSGGFVSEAMRSMAIMAIYGEGMKATSVDGITGKNSAKLAESCAQELYDSNPNIDMIMLLGPGLDVDGDALIQGIERVVGPKIPIFGALGGFGGTEPITPVFFDNQVVDHGLVLVGIAAPDLELVQVGHHGSLPQPDRFTVTRSEGTRVDEVDGKPAWPTFMASIDLPATTQPIEVINLIGLGLDLEEAEKLEYDNEKILRAPLVLDENGTSCFFQTAIPIGTVLTSCQRDEDYLIQGSQRLIDRLKHRLNGRQPLAVFHSDCMGRGRLAHNVVEKGVFIRDMQQALSDDLSLPWVGVYGFAEFAMLTGRNRHHNYTTTLSVVVNRESAS
jgi:hypothetical protein